jgi:predicted Fe-Mo cluster-binding NifX family protein
MKAALTVWEDRISPVFDVSREALIIEVVNRQVVNRELSAISAASILEKINWFLDRNVDALICGAISESLYREFQFHRMTVKGFVAGTVNDVIEAFVKDELHEDRFLMPGCGRHSGKTNRRQRRMGQK